MRRFISSFSAVAVVAGGLALLSPAPASAAGSLTLDKKAPTSALLGDDISYELVAANPGDGPQYNVGFSDVLPLGLKYKAGSVSPAAAGEPTKTTNGSGQQVLTWTNVADLQAKSDFTITFVAEPDASYDKLLSTQDVNNATVAGQDNERTIPKFAGNGTPIAGSYTNTATDSTTTKRTPFTIKKTEPSPENELLRGVHDQTTVYTLTITNNDIAKTNTVQITDYLPAGLEFLGCGGVDNTANGAVEYPGAPRLTATPAVGADCLTPTSVDTVQNPPQDGEVGPLTGVYTKVSWSLGSLDPGETVTIKYAAGIPLQANTMTWTTAPVGALGQAANLDNNSGASSREGIPESTLTNYVSGLGDFQGTPSGSVSTSTSETVSVEDLRLLKSVSPTKFTPGGIATFTLRVDASEYMNGSNIVITDTLPDGYCPLGPANYAPGSPNTCAPVAGQLPSVDYDSVTANQDGTYTIVFDPIAVQPNGTQTITFPVRMRTTYEATGKPTVGGDTFVNTASLSGTTTPIPAISGIESGTVTVGDTSRAEQTTALPTIDKTMKPRYVGVDCTNLTDKPYADYDQLSPAERTFRDGDIICFKLRVDFPDISTRNPVVSDFIPYGTEYVAGSAQLTANNTATATITEGSPLVATIGIADGNDYFVDPSQVFEMIMAVRVLKPASGQAPDLTGNLMKMRTENTAGQGESYRDEADYELAPPANLSIAKGVSKTTLPLATFDPPTDNKPVQQGSVATFRVDVTNRPRPEYPGTEFSARTLNVWDVLPGQLRCDAVSNFRYVKPGTTTVVALNAYVTCVDPPVNNQSDSSYLKWEFPGPATNDFTIFSGQTLGLLYDMAIPAEVSVSTKYDNTAYVRSFESYTNVLGEASTYYPKNNIDVTVPSDEWDAPEMKDPSSVYIPNATTGKTAITSVDETNNNAATQATIGETITYTYSVTVPANSTVYHGVLSDTLPTGIELQSIDTWYLNTQGNQPTGFTFDTNINTNPTGSLTFPTTYSNNTASNQVFTVKVTAKVTAAAATCATDPCVVPPSPTTNVARTNTAKFSSYTAADKVTKLPDRVRNYTINIVQPSPSVTKTSSPKNLPASNSPVTYTVKVANPTGRPPLHNSVVIDCLPTPLKADFIMAASQGSAVITTDPSCAQTDTAIKWTVGDIAPGTSPTLMYKAHLDGVVPGNTTYTNLVKLSGTSMPGDVTGERTYVTNANANIVTPAINLAKNTTPDNAAPGETVLSTIAVTLKANTVYYAPSLVDTLPAGVDPTSVATVGVTCVRASDGMPCTAPTATVLPASGQKVGWTFGHSVVSPFSGEDAIMTLVYRSTVGVVPGNVAGTTLTNSAESFSNNVITTPPTSIADAEKLPDKVGPVSDTVTVVEPDLDIVKKVDDIDAISAVPGQEFTYTVTVSNSDATNASTAFDAVISDSLPSGIEIVGSPSDGGVVSGSTITWTLGTLEPGGSKTFSYTARLKAPATGLQTNTAAIDEYFSLDNGEGRKYTGPSDTADVTPVLPELTITKYPGADLAYIDQPYTWILEIRNDSQATAYDIGATDTLPTNWQYVPGSAKVNVDGTASTPDPAVTGLELVWSALGDLPSGAKATIEYQTKPLSAVIADPGIGLNPPVPQVNTAVATWTDGSDGQDWPVHDTTEVTAETFIAKADLELRKSHVTAVPSSRNGKSVVPGTDTEWKIQVTNNGPDASAGPFTVFDNLPEGMSFKSNSGKGWSCTADGQLVECVNSASSLANGDSLPDLLIQVSIDPAVTGTLTNSAEVEGPTYDPTPENNSDQDTVNTRPLADLAIVKSGPQEYTVGQNAAYDIAVTNLGPSTSAPIITVTDTLPVGVSITSIDSGAWNCSPTSGVTTTLTCTWDQPLAPNTQADLITVTVEVLDSPGSQAVNTAVVTPTTEDPDPSNNESSVTDEVIDNVQLGLAKRTTGPDPVTAGENTQFTITVSNEGPAKAKNVQVVDELQTGLTALQAAGDGWTCDVGSGSRVVCTRENFKVANSPSDIVITAKVASSVPAGTTLSNTATVTTTSPQDGGDPDPATSDVDVVTKSDLAIKKTHRKGWVVNGTGRWDLTVTNNGASDNVGPITVKDSLPSAVEYISASGSGWLCQGAPGLVCTRDSGLIAGQSSVITITVRVPEGAVPSVVNTAEVSSPVEDPKPDNNTSTDRTPISRDKQTAKKLPPTPFVLPASVTEQGQKIHTRIRCLPLKSARAGEVSYCRVTRTKSGTVRVKVLGTAPVRVFVIQHAKGTKDYKPFKRSRKYIVRPGKN